MSSLKHLFCAIREHQDYLHFEKNRVYLECVSCGYESPGWTVNEKRTVAKFPAVRRARSLIRKIA
jgi:hypothetical protein